MKGGNLDGWGLEGWGWVGVYRGVWRIDQKGGLSAERGRCFILFIPDFQMIEEQSDSSEFVLKLIDMLENYGQVIEWSEDLTEIMVKNAKRFTEEVLPKYFRHSKLESFIRQLNMYNFYKVCRQKNNALSFKNDLFFKGNEANFCKIRRKKKNVHKTAHNDSTQENQAFIYEHFAIDPTTKSILNQILNFKALTVQTNKKLGSLLSNLKVDMKATKFKKYDGTIASLMTSITELDSQSDEIDESFKVLKDLKLHEEPIFNEQKAVLPDIDQYQRSLDAPFSQTNIHSTLIEHTGESRFESESNDRNFSMGIQTFLSITQFLGPSEAKIPMLVQLDEMDTLLCPSSALMTPVLEQSENSHMSIDDHLQIYC